MGHDQKGWRRRKERKFNHQLLETESGHYIEEAGFLRQNPFMWTSSGWPWGPDCNADDLDNPWLEPMPDRENNACNETADDSEFEQATEAVSESTACSNSGTE